MVERVLRKVLKESRVATEIFYHQQNRKLTRFANSEIHQNLEQDKGEVTVTVYDEGKKGSASTTDTGYASVKEALQQALKNASFQEPDPNFVSFPKPQKEEPPSLDSFSEATAHSTPAQRAEVVKKIVDGARQAELNAFGTFSNNLSRFSVINSEGLDRHWESTQAYLKTLMMGQGGEGYAEDLQVDMRDIEVTRVIERARQKCLDTKETHDVEPGDYTVILEPLAVGAMITYLNMIGFNGQACQEGRSFFSGKKGEKVVSPSITIIDDPWDPENLPIPYDFEGVTKKPLSLIEEGVFKNYVYDTYLANKGEAKSTGHCLPPEVRNMGAFPLNLKMKPGKFSTEEMISKTEKGILITRFHYLGVVHPTRTIITGLTRDGTFLIEKGQVKRALKNLRFTQSIIEALNNVQLVGNELERVPAFAGAVLTPSLMLDNFTFTGISKEN